MGNYCCDQKSNKKKKDLVSKKKINFREKGVGIPIDNDISKNFANLASASMEDQFNLQNLQIKSFIGKGGQGQVFLVDVTQRTINHETQIKTYAMKQISKGILQSYQSRQSIILENKIMTQFKSPFLSKLKISCQDQNCLYFFMDVAKGGDLYTFTETQLGKGQQFKNTGERGIKFLITGIILGLQELHSKNIIYRDLKAQNILIGQDGYPILTDFGLSIQQRTNCKQVKGTVLYFAPQIISGKGYDRGIDLWALGVLIHLLAFDDYPFLAEDILEQDYKELCSKKQMKHKKLSSKSSPLLKDLMNNLLKVKHSERLGYYNFDEIKSHPFFDDIDWLKYGNKQYQSPLAEIVMNYPFHSQQLSSRKSSFGCKDQRSFCFSNTRIYYSSKNQILSTQESIGASGYQQHH